MRQRLESFRKTRELVAMTHPTGEFFREPMEEAIRRIHKKLGVTIFAVFRPLHLALQEVANQLKAVADSENGQAEIQNFGFGERGLGGVNIRRRA